MVVIKSGERYGDLKKTIDNLQFENKELKRVLKKSICPNCHQIREAAHHYINGNDVACPAFSIIPQTGRKKGSA